MKRLIIAGLILAIASPVFADEAQDLAAKNTELRAKIERKKQAKKGIEALIRNPDGTARDITELSVTDLFNTSKKVGDFVHNFCGDFTDDPIKVAITGGLPAGIQRDQAAHMTRAFNEQFPGSNMNCMGKTGVFVSKAGIKYQFSNGEPIKVINDVMGNGLVQETSFTTYTTYTRIYDTAGNYITLSLSQIGLASYIDARLPITMTSNGTVLSNKGITLSGNELTLALNKVYAVMDPPGGTKDRFTFAMQLLLSQDNREKFAEIAINLLQPEKQNNKPAPASPVMPGRGK